MRVLLLKRRMLEKRVLLLKRRMLEKRVLLVKRRMLEKREEKRVLVMRQPMEEGMMRANRRLVNQVKGKTPEERAKVLLGMRHRARTRRSNRLL